MFHRSDQAIGANVTNIAEKKNSSQAKVNRCSIDIRGLPLERYRLPTDGRKWKQSARSRAAMLSHLSLFANADGTFVRESPGVEAKNFSPSYARMMKRFAHATFFRLTNDLKKLALLDWTRRDHHGRRIYTITPHSEHVSYSDDNTSHIRENTYHIQTEHVSPAAGDPEKTRITTRQKTRITSNNVPSLGLPSLESKSFRQIHSAKSALDFTTALPDWIPLEPWNGWIEMRKQKRVPNTPHSIKLAITTLTKLRSDGHDPGEVLDQSTLRGWTGLFEINETGNGKLTGRDLDIHNLKAAGHTRFERNLRAAGLKPRTITVDPEKA
jgi:hypothetical protein